MSDDLHSSSEKPGVTIETSPSNVQKSAAGKSAKTKERKQDPPKIGSWFKEIRAEFSKIIWPNKRDLAKMTVTVIFTSLIFGVLIAGLDTTFGFAVGILVDLF